MGGVGGGGWGVDVLYCKLVVAIVAGALLLAKNKEPRTTDTSLPTSYLSPILTFLPFWKSRGMYIYIYIYILSLEKNIFIYMITDIIYPKYIL